MMLFLGALLAGLGGAPSEPGRLAQTGFPEASSAGGFDGAGLAKSLTHPDHLKREATFAAVVESARVHQDLFAWLCARANDPAPTELSWTCRLAVRDLQRSAIERNSPSHNERQRAATHVGIFLRSESQAPSGVSVPGPAQKAPENLSAAGAAAPGSAWIAGTNSSLGAPFKNLPPGIAGDLWVTNFDIALNSKGPDSSGQVRRRSAEVTLRVIEPKGGQWVEREFSAENFEALLERHPEVGRRMEVLILQQQNVGAIGRLLPTAPSNGVPSLPLDPRRLGTYVGVDLSGDGLRVHDVVPGSLGQVLGLSRGDLLRELNGTPMRNNDDISRVLEARTPEGQVWATWVTASGIEKSATWQP